MFKNVSMFSRKIQSGGIGENSATATSLKTMEETKGQ